MAAIYCVEDNFGLTPPTNGYVEESSIEETVEWIEIPSKGKIVDACPQKHGNRSVSIRGYGDVGPGALPLGEFTEGEIQLTSRRRTESNSDKPKFDFSGQGFFNRAEAA